MLLQAARLLRKGTDKWRTCYLHLLKDVWPSYSKAATIWNPFRIQWPCVPKLCWEIRCLRQGSNHWIRQLSALSNKSSAISFLIGVACVFTLIYPKVMSSHLAKCLKKPLSIEEQLDQLQLESSGATSQEPDTFVEGTVLLLEACGGTEAPPKNYGVMDISKWRI